MQAQGVTGIRVDSLILSQQLSSISSRQSGDSMCAEQPGSAEFSAEPQPRSQVVSQAADENRQQKASQETSEKTRQLGRSLQRALHFELHKETGIMYVKVTDAENGKVLRELPMEQILDTLARIEKVVGLLVDGEA